MSNAERLARAVLLFHHGGEWTAAARAEWRELTGANDATTRVLCDLARQVWESEAGANNDSSLR